MNTNTRAVLSFTSDTNQTAVVSVPRANIDLTTDAAKEGMQDIIELGITSTTNGMPIAIKGAELVTTQRTNIIPG